MELVSLIVLAVVCVTRAQDHSGDGDFDLGTEFMLVSSPDPPTTPPTTPPTGRSELLDLLLARGKYRAALDKPNVILLVADDMGVGDLTSYGHPTQEPGFIDTMAAEGMRFTNGYVGDSVCTPSRSAIMTGNHNLASFGFSLAGIYLFIIIIHME